MVVAARGPRVVAKLPSRGVCASVGERRRWCSTNCQLWHNRSCAPCHILFVENHFPLEYSDVMGGNLWR